MNEAHQALRKRTRDFALAIIRLYTQLPRTQAARVLGSQFLRSGTSPGAHYREAHRSRSTAEFISKIEVAIQELDETDYWLDLLVEGRVMPSAPVEPLWLECNELIAMLVASVRTAKQRQ